MTGRMALSGKWALAIVLVAAPVSVRTADDLCGTTIVDDLKLHHDLFCTADGLIVGADGITIDLDGHAITGSGLGVGIAVTGRTDVTVTGGTIRNFAVGIRLNSSTNVLITRNQLIENPEGIDLQAGSVGNTIKENALRGSVTRAIMLRSNSSDNDIRSNVFTENRVGILVFGGVDNTVRWNVVTGSTLAGIRLNVIATGNHLKGNGIWANVVGVEFLVTLTGSAVGNELRLNTIAGNECGVKGPTAGNELTFNWLVSNVAGTCP